MIKALGCRAKEFRARIHRIEHHQAHIAAGFLISPYEEAAVLSIDSMGDFTSTLTAKASGTAWTELDRVYFPHSVGFFDLPPFTGRFAMREFSCRIG